MRLALEPIGWHVSEAENGLIALDSLSTARPDVIILDLMMPEMDGFEFLDELRARPMAGHSGRGDHREGSDRSRPRRLNGGVERIIQKSDRDEMLRRLTGELSKWAKPQDASGCR